MTATNDVVGYLAKGLGGLDLILDNGKVEWVQYLNSEARIKFRGKEEELVFPAKRLITLLDTNTPVACIDIVQRHYKYYVLVPVPLASWMTLRPEGEGEPVVFMTYEEIKGLLVDGRVEKRNELFDLLNEWEGNDANIW